MTWFGSYICTSSDSTIRTGNGLRQLIAIDARVRVADRFAGPLSDAPYFGNYALIAAPQRAALGDVDDEPVVVLLEQRDGEWTPPFGCFDRRSRSRHHTHRGLLAYTLDSRRRDRQVLSKPPGTMEEST